MDIKHIFYDLAGYNIELFSFLNHIVNNYYIDRFLIYFTHLGENEFFLIYFALIAMSAVIINYRAEFKDEKTLSISANVIIVFLISYILELIIVYSFKKHFAYTRPFCVGEHLKVREILDYIRNEDCHKTFPSGHGAFSLLLLASLWPALNINWRIIGVVSVFLVWFSRVSLGFHFPVDVVYGGLISCVIVLIVRKFYLLLLEEKCLQLIKKLLRLKLG